MLELYVGTNCKQIDSKPTWHGSSESGVFRVPATSCAPICPSLAGMTIRGTCNPIIIVTCRNYVQPIENYFTLSS